MEKENKLCYNVGKESGGGQPKDGLAFILSLPLDKKQELLSVLRERRNNGLVYEKGNP